VSIHDIALVSGMAEATIKLAYRDLYPEAHRLVPRTYATPEQIKTLPLPMSREAGGGGGGGEVPGAVKPKVETAVGKS